MRQAASVVVARPANADGQDFEILMHRRSAELKLAGGSMVFPGGGLDDEDSDPAWQNLLSASDDQADLHTARVGAVRELYEESGVLLGMSGTPAPAGVGTPFLDIARQNALSLTAADLPFIVRWVPPQFVPKRFDTLFFLADMPAGQTASHDGIEAIMTAWVSPRRALVNIELGDWSALFPTVGLLADLARFDRLADLRASLPTRSTAPMCGEPVEDEDGEIWLDLGEQANHLPYRRERLAIVKKLLHGNTLPLSLALPDDLRAALPAPD